MVEYRDPIASIEHPWTLGLGLCALSTRLLSLSRLKSLACTCQRFKGLGLGFCIEHEAPKSPPQPARPPFSSSMWPEILGKCLPKIWGVGLGVFALRIRLQIMYFEIINLFKYFRPWLLSSMWLEILGYCYAHTYWWPCGLGLPSVLYPHSHYFQYSLPH